MARSKAPDETNVERNRKERERSQHFHDKLQVLMGYLPKAPYLKRLKQEDVITLAIAELARIRPIVEDDNNYRISRPVQVEGKTKKLWLKSSEDRKTYKPDMSQESASKRRSKRQLGKRRWQGLSLIGQRRIGLQPAPESLSHVPRLPQQHQLVPEQTYQGATPQLYSPNDQCFIGLPEQPPFYQEQNGQMFNENPYQFYENAWTPSWSTNQYTHFEQQLGWQEYSGYVENTDFTLL